MIVKIGDEWFNSAEVPIAVRLTDDDRQNIAKMNEGPQFYASFPEGHFGDDGSGIVDWLGLQEADSE